MIRQFRGASFSFDRINSPQIIYPAAG